ncbi:MAG: hypothetical protein AB1782_20285 [Cyanobacteriota bacterium]
MTQIENLMKDLNLTDETITNTVNKINSICSRYDISETTGLTGTLPLLGNGDGNGDGCY